MKILPSKIFYEKQHKCIESWLKRHGYAEMLLEPCHISAKSISTVGGGKVVRSLQFGFAGCKERIKCLKL